MGLLLVREYYTVVLLLLLNFIMRVLLISLVKTQTHHSTSSLTVKQNLDTQMCANPYYIYTYIYCIHTANTCTCGQPHTLKHTHTHTHTHTTLCSSEAVPFHVRMVGLICGKSVPCCGGRGLNQSGLEQGGRDEEFLMTDERCILIPVCGEEKTWKMGKTGGLMSWSRKKNKGRKGGRGWGIWTRYLLYCSCTRLIQHTGEWPFNSKPTFTLVHTHQGPHI